VRLCVSGEEKARRRRRYCEKAAAAQITRRQPKNRCSSFHILLLFLLLLVAIYAIWLFSSCLAFSGTLTSSLKHSLYLCWIRHSRRIEEGRRERKERRKDKTHNTKTLPLTTPLPSLAILRCTLTPILPFPFPLLILHGHIHTHIHTHRMHIYACIHTTHHQLSPSSTHPLPPFHHRICLPY
jgi:hypothetical protein